MHWLVFFFSFFLFCLFFCVFSRWQVKELVEALQNAPDGTEYVKLGGNSYSKEAIAAIAPVIASRFSLLKHADFEVAR